VNSDLDNLPHQDVFAVDEKGEVLDRCMDLTDEATLTELRRWEKRIAAEFNLPGEDR